jgi:hypothetical protein
MKSPVGWASFFIDVSRSSDARSGGRHAPLEIRSAEPNAWTLDLEGRRLINVASILSKAM